MGRPLTLVFAFMLLAAAGAPASAEESREQEIAKSHRALNGHLFIPSPFVTGPFSTTHVGAASAYATASAKGQLYNIQGVVVGGKTYTMAGFGNNFLYQKRLVDWMALRVNVQTLIFSGIDGPSALVTGATFRSNGGIGLTAGLPIARAFRLAAVFDASFAPAIDLTVAQGLIRAIQTGNFDSGEVFVLGKTFEVRPGISFAWAPWPVAGLQAEIRYVYTNVDKSSSENATGDFVDMAFSADVDLREISPVAIGVQATYRLEKPVSGDTFRTQDVGGGIYYTGRPHLATGLAAAYQWFHLRPELDATAFVGQFVVRYYW